jgi:hypothetical protein
MTTECGFSQVSIWRLHEFVSKKAQDKPAEDDVQHFNDRSYHLLTKVSEDIIQYTVLA